MIQSIVDLPAKRDVAAATSVPRSPSSQPAIHTATLLALLRAGEQSAACAFGRIVARLSAAEEAMALPDLTTLIRDEKRHDDALAAYCSTLPEIAIGDARTRRFFRGLESREPIVHLARVAALDGCVCRVLTHVLQRAAEEHFEASLVDLLTNIRADEARHVRMTRHLVLMLGADVALLRGVDLDVRDGFATLLVERAASFEALSVDCAHLAASLRREH